jgi:hypothetical protein
VLLIMTDDAGYGVSGTFGGVHPRSTGSRKWGCATPSSTLPHCARRRARR